MCAGRGVCLVVDKGEISIRAVPIVRRSISRRNLLFLVVISLALLVVIASTGSSARSGALTASASPVDPVPYFYITWTATAKGFTDTTENDIRSVRSRQITMGGSTVVRVYLDGHQDDFPFDLTVTDDFDEVNTVPCPGGSREHNHWSIIDPHRYTGGPEKSLGIDATQDQNGNWYIGDPFAGFFVNRLFTYRVDSETTYCDGETKSDSLVAQLGSEVDLRAPTYSDQITLIQGDADGNTFTINRQFQADLNILPVPLKINWSMTARRLIGRDLTVERMEVTQGLQDVANTIPLVQDRRTVVRAYLGVGKDQMPISNVTGKLTGYSGNTVLGSVRPFNPGGRITAPALPDWHQIDHTLNFELPLAWTEQPLLRLEVEVNDDKTVTEINYNNNKLSALVTTISCFGVSIAYVVVHYTPPEGYTPADPTPNIFVGQEFMRKIYPIPEKELKYSPWPELRWHKSISTTDGGKELLMALLYRKLMSSTHTDRIFGWTPSGAFFDNGLGLRPGTAAFGNDTESPNRWRRTFAHEIGHNEGLRHTDQATTGSPDQTTNGRHWFDVYDRVIKPPNQGGELLDMMVPAKDEPEAWISPESYFNLMTELCVPGSQAPAARPQAPTASDNLIVSGIVMSGTPPEGGVDPLVGTATAQLDVPPPPQAGPGYCVNLKNNTTSLSQYCFDVGFDGDGQPASAMPFGMVVMYRVGLNRM